MAQRSVEGSSTSLLPQLIIAVCILVGIGFMIRLGSGSAEIDRINGVFDAVQADYDNELAKQEQLQAPRRHAESIAAVDQYNRDERKNIIEGERVIIPSYEEQLVAQENGSIVQEDPANYAKPWQMWWRLFTDRPIPTP